MMALVLRRETLEKFQKEFEKDPKNRLAQNVCTKIDLKDLCQKRTSAHLNHVVSHKVDVEGRPPSNQKVTGRCWLFACLNAIRVPVMRHFQLDELEFSPAYLFFWDKIERSNYFLNNVVEMWRRGEPVEGRLFSFLLREPLEDGGQWHMVSSLVAKHGLVPKQCYPESTSSEASRRFNQLLTSKLREFARDLYTLLAKGCSDADVQSAIEHMMETVYRITSICLGTPPATFTWEYYDKNKAYNRLGPITPLEFYEKHVKPLFNFDDKVCLVNDTRPSNPFGDTYTVDCLGNVVGGIPIVYNNQPMDVFMQSIVDSIKGNEPVWFGCEVVKRCEIKRGVFDTDFFDYEALFGTTFTLAMSRADRLIYGESCMGHAMLFTGVSVDADGKPVKFRVENSWGDDTGEKGFFTMTRDWFNEFVFEVVVDKKYLPAEVIAANSKEAKVLPAWDPMGALAH
uniref:Bleomycin hydrolase n=1 Tax=Amblyomma maculatum TaxID=34609 RepID=G3MM93_AMBMU